MPTKRPRISLVIEPELHEALLELRRASGITTSSFLSSMLSEAVPMVRAMTESFRLAKGGMHAPLEPMKDAIDRAMIDVAQVRLDLDKKPKRRKLRKAHSA